MKSDYCYQPITVSDMKKIFQGVPLKYNLWDEFEFYELTINQRQKEDLEYSRMLNRIRVGSQTEEDIILLKNQLIPEHKTDKIANAVDKYISMLKNNSSIIALFSLIKSVDKFNKFVSNKLGK